eukprot:c5427_g1_i2.p1 GENE.c5427_g1_i2~~c5427_g1_i2.p1  ORF type:complete len:1360 (+),score=346.01 c5427_g1_i2:60-4139(+)
MASSESTQEWRLRVLAESERLKANLKEAKKRREAAKKEQGATHDRLNLDQIGLDALEDAHERLAQQTSRLRGVSVEVDARVGEANEAQEVERSLAGQLAMLELAQKEMEKTAQKIEQIDTEVAQTSDEDTSSTLSSPVLKPSQSLIENAETTWMHMTQNGGITERPMNFEDSPVSSNTQESPAKEEEEEEDEEEEDPTPQSPQSPPPQKQEQETVVPANEPVPVKPKLPVLELQKDKAPKPEAQKEAQKETHKVEFAMPAKPEQVTFETIAKPMKVKASPLVFFNLACFQGSMQNDSEVMQPICGYAIATHTLAVLGPVYTNTSVLRVALSGMESSHVFVTNFTVKSLVDLADSTLTTGDMDKSKSLLENLGLEAAADVVIGTCIQRGAREGVAGTPRGSRNPENPTPRKLDAKTFPNTQIGLYKSILLIEDLSTLLKAEEIFKVLRVIRKAVLAERAAAIVALTRPFEKRGLLPLFDDVLIFSNTGVMYFGPVKGLTPYCSLIGCPCPAETHVVDHIEKVPDAVSRYRQSQLYNIIDEVIIRFSGTQPQTARTEQSETREVATPDAQDPMGPPKKVVKKKTSAFTLLGKKKSRKAKEEQVPEALENSADPHRARKVMQKLADERRHMAMNEKDEQKLSVWKNLAEVDGSVEEAPIRNQANIILELEAMNKKHRPSCFVNLACFIAAGKAPDTPAFATSVAFISEGLVLGVMGDTNTQDAAALLSTLKTSGGSTIVSDLSVADALKINEFVSSKASKDHETLNRNVEMLVAKMMLTACAQEIVGTLVQRTTETVPADPSTQIQIGDQIFSTASRSLLILDRLSSLDAQSLYVVLRLIRRMAKDARLAVTVLLTSPAERKGLTHLMDNLLIFDMEGMFYFGPTRDLKSYCKEVDFPCPQDSHIIDHVANVMQTYSPVVYNPANDNLETPFTVRYQFSAISKYNTSIINVATKTPEQGGLLSSRTMVPKSARKSGSKAEILKTSMEALELTRQRKQVEREALESEKTQGTKRLAEKEQTWRNLLKNHPELIKTTTAPLAAGITSIALELKNIDKRPCVFFNLASLLPNVISVRADIFQPVTAYAFTGRFIGIMGPEETDLVRFMEALSKLDNNSTVQPITVKEFLDSMNSDVPPPTFDQASQNANLGHILVRNQKPSILILSPQFIDNVSASHSFRLLSYIHQVSSSTDLTTLLNLHTPNLRRGLLSLTDDCLVFDHAGVAYFGPTNRFNDYLVLAGYTVPANMDPTDYIFEVMHKHSQANAIQVPTNTSPAVRFRYCAIADAIREFVERFIPSDSSASIAPEKKKTFFGPKRTARKSDVDEAAMRLAAVAEAEAEAERQRIAEVNAERMWQRLAAETGGL